MATFERHEGQNPQGFDPDSKDQDLEQYGVWVKAEPQDIFEDSEGEVYLSQTDEPTLNPLPDESFLTEEEENILGATEESVALWDKDDAPSSDFDLPSIPNEEQAIEIPALDEETSVEPEPILPDITDFESMEDLGVPIEEFTPENPAEGTRGVSPVEEFEDVSEFGLEEPEAVIEEGAQTDFEPIDIDLKFDDTLPPRPEGGQRMTSQSSGNDGFEIVTDFDEFLNNPETQESLELEPEDLELSVEEESLPTHRPGESLKEDEFSLDDIPSSPMDTSIDDVAELERELSGSPDSIGGSTPPKEDISSEILLKIAGELSSIKEELISLKAQLAAIKTESAEVRAAPEEGGKSDSGMAGGFFDEEEDETIALTGDELDNILNTAEFAEESAEEAASVPEGALEDLLPETGDYTTEDSSTDTDNESAIEEIRLNPSEDQSSGGPEEAVILTLAEEGVLPITPPPEDTSYLEEIPEASEEISLSSEDELMEAPLLEPTPEELDIDDLVEDHFEDAEELPLADFESEEGEEEPADLIEDAEELEELTLDVESEPSDIVLEAPESVHIPLPEVEEGQNFQDEPFEEFVEELPAEDTLDEYGEIALHNEEPMEAPHGKAAELGELPLPEAESISQEDLEPFPEAAPLEEERFEPISEEPAAAPQPEEDLLVEDLEALESSDAHPAEAIPDRIKDEVKSVLSYLDKLLESLPEEKIDEFAKSEHFETYKRLFEELGLV